MNLINEWGRACTVSCDAMCMLMVSSSVSASWSVDSAVFQMSQCLAKIRIVIQNRWSCLRTKESWCKLMEGWSWKKWQSLTHWMPCYTHSHPGFTDSRSDKEGSFQLGRSWGAVENIHSVLLLVFWAKSLGGYCWITCVRTVTYNIGNIHC